MLAEVAPELAPPWQWMRAVHRQLQGRAETAAALLEHAQALEGARQGCPPAA